MQFEALHSQRRKRVLDLSFAIASLTGSQASSITAIPEGFTQCTAAKTATGVVVINFAKPFLRSPVVMAIPLHASQHNFCTIGAVSTSSVTINVWNDTGVAADPTSLHVIVDGFDAVDQI